MAVYVNLRLVVGLEQLHEFAWIFGIGESDALASAFVSAFASAFARAVAVLFLHEKIGRRRPVLATVLAVLGVALVVARP